uniref:Uncharacterized protein n=1 Tax=Oryza brachyantha TaxID=4533 RepID=J3NC37_ORYBR
MLCLLQIRCSPQTCSQLKPSIECSFTHMNYHCAYLLIESIYEVIACLITLINGLVTSITLSSWDSLCGVDHSHQSHLRC